MDPYRVLGLSPSASKEEAKAAYRKLAQQHHPDKGGSEVKFKEIKTAWEQIEKGVQRPQATRATPGSGGEAPY